MSPGPKTPESDGPQGDRRERVLGFGCGWIFALAVGTGAAFVAGWIFESKVVGVIAGLVFTYFALRISREPEPPKSDVYAPAGKVLCPGCKDTWIEVARKPWKCDSCGRVMLNREVGDAIAKGSF